MCSIILLAKPFIKSFRTLLDKLMQRLFINYIMPRREGGDLP
jgi:hypothetical protein